MSATIRRAFERARQAGVDEALITAELRKLVTDPSIFQVVESTGCLNWAIRGCNRPRRLRGLQAGPGFS
ncbi:MAG: hypothetical protein JO153_07440 [Solirubrobacterales bacterium]|nr:hypothetical protein [Solirubrobacterales bacterium]